MLKRILKSLAPEWMLHEWRKAKFNPKLKAMGINPRPVRPPLTYLGTEYGGHAVDTARIGGDSVVYTIGAGLDISFEEALIEKSACNVHVYDPTPRSVTWLTHRFGPSGEKRQLASRLAIHPQGIWSEDSTMKFYAPRNPDNVSHSLANLQKTEEFIEVQCLSLKSAMRLNGHSRIDLLKLNVEGAEYAILNTAFDHGIKPGMILINYDEVHTEGDERAAQRLAQLAARISSQGYNAVFAELARVTYVRET